MNARPPREPRPRAAFPPAEGLQAPAEGAARPEATPQPGGTQAEDGEARGKPEGGGAPAPDEVGPEARGAETPGREPLSPR